MANSRIIKLALIFILAFCLCGCDKGDNGSTRTVKKRVPDGEYGIVLITDSGNISDRSFNQSSYEAARDFAKEHDITFTAKKPEADTDEAKEEMIRLAANEGYNIIILPGYSFAGPIISCSKDYPDVKFIALDVSQNEILYAALGDKYDPEASYNVADYYNSENTYLITYKEEQSGFMAGFAAVKMGYKKLGFMGGVAEPAVMRFGYGFMQGADAAASLLNIQNDVSMKYAYADTYSPNIEIMNKCSEWYKSGTEVIFSCGGSIYSSVAEAAFRNDGKMIGVDVDQKEAIDYYGDGIAITSATKGLGASVTNALNAIVTDDSWSELAGKIDNLGLKSCEDLSENYVQLAESTVWTDSFDEDDYRELVKDILNGKYTISNDTDSEPGLLITVDHDNL